ncbi:MAG: Rieske 2Fe-2S domain-containing protein [Chloroflexi bacterium]|nr:Rieske 2Fe-2S domain-containing protein [Chloroflexota bacterium]
MSTAGNDEFVRVAKLGDVPAGTIAEVEIDEQVLVLANVDGGLYAMSAWCTHLGTSLMLGRLSGCTLTCYAHLWRFDVRTGEPIWPPMARIVPGYRLRTHPVRVEGDEILVSRRPGRPSVS